jgi:hypothetical protein
MAVLFFAVILRVTCEVARKLCREPPMTMARRMALKTMVVFASDSV